MSFLYFFIGHFEKNSLIVPQSCDCVFGHGPKGRAKGRQWFASTCKNIRLFFEILTKGVEFEADKITSRTTYIDRRRTARLYPTDAKEVATCVQTHQSHLKLQVVSQEQEARAVSSLSTAWCSEIGSAASQDAREFHGSRDVRTNFNFDCTKLYLRVSFECTRQVVAFMWLCSFSFFSLFSVLFSLHKPWRLFFQGSNIIICVDQLDDPGKQRCLRFSFGFFLVNDSACIFLIFWVNESSFIFDFFRMRKRAKARIDREPTATAPSQPDRLDVSRSG